MSDNDVSPILGPTPERIAQAGPDGMEDRITDDSKLGKRMLDGSVLSMLLSRGSIDGYQYAAGFQYNRDWFDSGLASVGVVDTTKQRVDGGGWGSPSDRSYDAFSAYNAAYKAVGVVHSEVLSAVVLFDVKLADYGQQKFNYRDRRQAGIAALSALKGALDQLEMHYCGHRKTRIRSAHTEDSRPTIQLGDRSGDAG